jgi:hypothetical protein
MDQGGQDMRFRTRPETVQVDKTVGGKTHRVDRTQDKVIPVVPKDWDAIALAGVRAATTLSVLGAMAWSTVSIGGLLSRVAPSWVAYTVAGVFDLAWIVCMLLEWLARNSPEQASLPRKAGWAALAISMALIVLHGHVQDFLLVGVGGALVSAIAKSMWSVVMGFGAVELDEENRGWLQAERQEVGTQLAMTQERRKLTRALDRVESERLALGQDVPQLETDRTPPLPEPAVLSEDEKTKAVRALARAMDIPVRLFGLDETQDTARVPAVRDRTQDTVVHLDRVGRPSVQSTVNKIYKQDPYMDGTDVRSAVRDVMGQDITEGSIAKAITRSPYRRTGTE